MKKIVALFVFAVLCCLMFQVASAAGSDPVQISTADGLKAIASDPTGSYVLTADIDMKGVDWAPLEFHGKLDGGGHKIYNLSITKLGEARATTVDGNNKKYDTSFAGLFSVVRDAEIKNLNLLNVNVRITTDQNCFIAGLAGFAENTTITGCSVQGREYLNQSFHMVGVGGLVGFGNGTISGCNADVEIVFIDSDLQIKCEEFIGAILACGYSNIDDCSVKLRAYASVQGYCHNGGVVGMYYIYVPADKRHPGHVNGCTSDTAIYFYENNTDRRAYCNRFIGEMLSKNTVTTGNKSTYFKNGETKNYKKYLLPEKDENPVYTSVVTPPTCTTFGYTTYTCTTCGYSYTDDYVAPQHTPGEWQATKAATETQEGVESQYCTVCGKLLQERAIPVLPPKHVHTPGDWQVVKEPTYDAPGLKQQVCTSCGEVVNQEEIPKLVAVSSCALDKTELALNAKDTAKLTATVQPADAALKDLKWTSSDEKVATVDAQGNVKAMKAGKAVIACASADGKASATCTVTVSYTFWQWIVVYILFGWIWY